MPTRRDFLRMTAASAGAAALSPLVSAEAIGLPPGIQLYSVRDDLAKDVPGTLRQLRQIGFVEVETAGFYNHSAAEFRKLIEDAGLRAPSAHLGMTPSDCQQFFDQAKTLGAAYAVSSSLESALHPPAGKGFHSGPLGPDEFHRLADAMNELGGKAKQSGLQYAYHNHNYEFVRMPDGGFGYDILVKNTDPGLVKLEIDCGWMCAAGADPVHYMTAYPGRVRMLHIKEFAPVAKPSTSLAAPERPKGVDLGQGFIDYKPIFAAARKAGVQHAFSEQENPFPVSQMASAKAAYQFLHNAS